jgi:hypothetical protein
MTLKINQCKDERLSKYSYCISIAATKIASPEVDPDGDIFIW